jgi:ABC-2 type transport system permease protein
MFRTILALMRKELIQVVRDRNMLLLIFLMPLIQLLVLGYAINVDVKNIDTVVYDFDRSQISREYIRSFSAGDYFTMQNGPFSLLESTRGFKENLYKNVLIIPDGFSEEIRSGKPTTVGFLVDGINANSAAISIGYAGMISGKFSEKYSGFSPPIKIRQRQLYNPEAESIYFMVPGIVAVLLTMVTVMLTAMAIVREREIGTLEQLMVTPISTPALILGKTIPFAILGFIEMSIALLFGVLWFGIPFAGSWS